MDGSEWASHCNLPTGVGACAIRWLNRVVVASLVVLGSALVGPAAQLPRSVLILDQSARDSVWFDAFFSGFRSTLNTTSAVRVSVYSEHLDLSRFGGARHDELLRRYLRDKFSERPIGVVVAQGSSALEFVLRSRAELWPGVPVIFASVDEETGKRLSLPPDVTGTLYQRPFRDAVATARLLVPNLKRIALVGDPFERQAVRGHYKQEVPVYAAEFELIDLMGLSMAELRRRVATLPGDTAIIYTAINVDGAGVAYRPYEALAAFAEVANRPIVIDAETNMGHGGAGGFVTTPGPVGEAAARLALRILDGEDASKIPVTTGDFTRPVFDWRQLHRFGISESRLPAGSEIRFRSPSAWEQYRWYIIGAFTVIALQAVLIVGLLLQRARRRRAEAETQRLNQELTHVGRVSVMGHLASALVHELNQPLTAILSNAQAGQRFLAAEPTNLKEVSEILKDIVQDNNRASEVIRHMRALVKKEQLELAQLNLAGVIGDVVALIHSEAILHSIGVELDLALDLPMARGDKIQLQQVVLNLLLNAFDAMKDCPAGERTIMVRAARNGSSMVEIAVRDRGTGLAADNLDKIFQPFYTTKREGLGMGLSISRSIVEAHGGTLWVENNPDRGATFYFTIPVIAEGNGHDRRK
jgi:signal transduction histidine kinase